MKNVLIGLILGFGIGIWFGINIGKGNALYDNPLSDSSVIEDAHDSADDVGLIDQTEALIEKGKEHLKESVKESIEKL